ncbi:NAD(P)H-hydrate epimerase [Silvibacterium bohemicum]|uniref:Bifunctional NAD(P)H-hydrate repair enzyme n=1 Tax=Silvibacterium bohemicum TaxID=1577686 RepID=A0A841JM29_9BACT|nr:bifunctional ADP-dependent NAD(P)H-hydrate dehydratase/NAD(P)H-hydrate epimerase [Silvibacterium bohemicum]MBB6142283.1 NAD(P)H-hydrate epimerase [Silvibacterium bohemicum]
MKILTAEEMRATDRVTVEKFGVASIDLMRHAGAAVARFVEREYAGCRRIVALCGKGNNGGDGFVAARNLAASGCEVQVLLIGSPEDLKGDAKTAFDEMGIAPVVIGSDADLESSEVRKILENAELILDAVVGTGFKPPLRGIAATLRDRLNAMTTPVIAVDLPSGWDADSREFNAEGAYRADAVVTFTAPKLAHVCGDLTGGVYGAIVVAQIGSPEGAIQSDLNLSWAGAFKQITDAPRKADSNKGMYGHVLLIGGARGKSGAPSMASLAALRTGAGLVTAAVAESILPEVAGVTPELMTIALKEAADGSIDSDHVDFDELLDRMTVLAIGPGLGQSLAAEDLVLKLLEKAKVPLVLDADALNILARHSEKIDGRGRAMVLTPHPGEMARLARISTREVQANREPLAREFAIRHQVTLVLKGWRTLIAHPDGSMAINTTGNPGMAKGGSGDILTGIVAAMVAQHPDRIADAVNAAVYLHGLAADLAVREQDEHTLLATDTVAHLWRAFRFRPQDAAGYVWVQGLPRSTVEKR